MGSLTPFTSLDRTARAALRTAFRRPGALYQPVAIAPVEDRDVLDADVAAIADIESLAVARGLAEARQALARRVPAVLLVTPDEAEIVRRELEEAGVTGVQVLIWGTTPPINFPSAVQEWISDGLLLSPVQGAAGEGFMATTLTHCARERSLRYNPVFILSTSAGRAFAAQEAHLRLEIAGFERTVTLDGDAQELARALRNVRASAAVLPLPAVLEGGSEALLDAVNSAIERGVQIVLVTEPRVRESLARRPGWEPLVQRAIAISAPDYSEGGEPASQGDPASRATIDVRDLLVGAPNIGAPPRVTFKGELTSLPLADVLQTLAVGRSGALVVYAAEHVGLIELDGGRVVSARDLSDHRTLAELADARGHPGETAQLAALLVEERVCTIGAWQEASFVFLPAVPEAAGSADARASLDPGAIAMEMVRRFDEAERREARVGGLGRIWVRAGAAPATEGGSAIARLWDALDGERTLAQAATAAGLLYEEAFSAVRALQAEGRVRATGEGPVRDRLGIAEVVTHLLAWGLVSEAREVLRAARGRRVTPDAALLVGYLQALEDLKVGYSYYQAAAKKLSGGDTSNPRVAQLLLTATLNAALLGYRSDTLSAADAWNQARAEVDAGRLRYANSPRYTAILAHLALAAGDHASAQKALDGLRAFDTDESRRLLARLQQLC